MSGARFPSYILGEEADTFSSFDLYWWTGFLREMTHECLAFKWIDCRWRSNQTAGGRRCSDRILETIFGCSKKCFYFYLFIYFVFVFPVMWTVYRLLLHGCRLSGCHRRCRRERDWMWSSPMMDHGTHNAASTFDLFFLSVWLSMLRRYYLKWGGGWGTRYNIISRCVLSRVHRLCERRRIDPGRYEKKKYIYFFRVWWIRAVTAIFQSS